MYTLAEALRALDGWSILRLPFLIALFALFFVVSPSPTDQTALTALQQGDELSADSWTVAAATYRQAVARLPHDPEPHLRLGQLHLRWQRPAQARDAFFEAAQRGGDLRRVGAGLREAYAALGNWEAVATLARMALARQPEDLDALQDLAEARFRQGMWDAAWAAWEQVLARQPSDADALYRLGLMAVASAGETASLPLGLSYLQQAHRQTTDQDRRQAIETVIAALGQARGSDDPAYRFALLGQALLRVQEPRLAAYSLRQAVTLNPAYGEAYAWLGQALDLLGEGEAALDALRQAVALVPASPVAHTLLGLYWDRRGETTLARAAYEMAYDLDPTNAALCLEIGGTYAEEGAFVAAEIWLRAATWLAPQDPEVWLALARFYLDQGVDRGLGPAQRAVALAPQRAEAHDLLGWAYTLRGEYERALAELQQALALDPTLASAYKHLGRLLELQGDLDAARRAYARAADWDPRWKPPHDQE